MCSSDLMLVLWNGTPPMTRSEIEKVINTKKKLASTTILSLLTRLESKNFVEVTKQGKLNLYTPLVSQSDYQAHESQSVLEKLYGNSLKKFVTSLYQGKKISSEEIHELSDFLKELEDGEESAHYFGKWMYETAQTSKYNKPTERTAPHRYFHPAEFLWLPKWKRQRLKCPSPDSPPSMRKRLRSAIQQYHRQTAAAHA